MKSTEGMVRHTSLESHSHCCTAVFVSNLRSKVNCGDFDVLQTSYWDPQIPHVLHWRATDLEKAEPSKWTSTCQFFLDKDWGHGHLRSSIVSPGSHQMEHMKFTPC
jgi:hypothetical protein